VTPTNLLYNVIAIPGALWQFHSTRLYRRSTRQVEAAEIPIEG
jgi:hypothetical protein